MKAHLITALFLIATMVSGDDFKSQGGEELKVEVIQVLADGILASGSVFVWRSGHWYPDYRTEKPIFLQGFSGVAEGEVFEVQAHAEGTYTYRDASGASRTLEKWVFTKLIKRLK